MVLVPPFAAGTASTLLGRLCSRFRSVFVEVFAHSSRRALQGQALMLDEKSWLAVSVRVDNYRRLMSLNSEVCAGQSSSSTPE